MIYYINGKKLKINKICGPKFMNKTSDILCASIKF